jgi:hypothetical protein
MVSEGDAVSLAATRQSRFLAVRRRRRSAAGHIKVEQSCAAAHNSIS